MSNVIRETLVVLPEEERRKLKAAIEVCNQIAHDCICEDMFVDASSVFACIYDSCKNGEVPTTVHIYE